ncbi:MAG: hypothetical protein R3F61_38175 [Myxococcota bacterium]
MSRLAALLCAFLVATACTGSGVGAGPCEDLCRELVQTCGYAAFPDLGSCLDGCAYYEQQGADVNGQKQCVEEAACDTFLIVECEHAYGLDQ